MKLNYFTSICASFLLMACAKKEDPFLVTANSIGALTHTTSINELETVFANDSIVKRVAGDGFINSGTNEIEVYDKSGNQMLILEATEDFDTLATIKSVRVIDPRFKTAKGFNAASTFKELKDNYTIGKITNTLSVAMITIDELNAYVAINKKELPKELLFDTKSKIEAVQIPDSAKIKYFWLDWAKK